MKVLKVVGLMILYVVLETALGIGMPGPVPVHQVDPVPVEAAAVPPVAETTAATDPMVWILSVNVPTYLYRFNEGEIEWYLAGFIPADALAKVGPCWGDGYRQVEYQDRANPKRWKVEFMKCE